MPFVKLDCGMLDSTIWDDREARELFITALLMAEPRETTETIEQIEVRSLNQAGFSIPPGWYGFVPAAGSGIIRRAGMPQEKGLDALERLGSPDPESRTPDFEGRRLVRVDGGYLVLNYDKYRQKDHTAAERQQRFRDRRRSNAVTDYSNGVTKRDVTQAEAEAEADNPTTQTHQLASQGGLFDSCESEAGILPKAQNPRPSRKPSKKRLPANDAERRLSALFHRRPTTPLSSGEVAKFDELHPINIEDIPLLEAYYAAERQRKPRGNDRRDLQTLLNNFENELDRSRGWMAKQKEKTQQPARKGGW